MHSDYDDEGDRWRSSKSIFPRFELDEIRLIENYRKLTVALKTDLQKRLAKHVYDRAPLPAIAETPEPEAEIVSASVGDQLEREDVEQWEREKAEQRDRERPTRNRPGRPRLQSRAKLSA